MKKILFIIPLILLSLFSEAQITEWQPYFWNANKTGKSMVIRGLSIKSGLRIPYLAGASLNGYADSTGMFYFNTTSNRLMFRSAGAWVEFPNSTESGGGSGVSSITGTANQVIASASTGAITLSLPQSLGTTSTPTFGATTLNGDLTSTGFGHIINSSTGTNRGTKLFVQATTDNFGQLGVYPSSGTNVSSTILVIPKGTGNASTTKSYIGVHNTDIIADATNYELGTFKAAGSDGFGMLSLKGGTGTLRSLFFDASGTGTAATNAIYVLATNNRVGIGGTTAPTAKLHITGGSATANTAPLKLTSGTLLTTAEAGAEEFLTDKRYTTITTGAARKEYTLNDVALNSGIVPYTTTNGRLTNSTITSTELGYLSGATSNIPSQLSTNTSNISANTTAIGLKADITSPTFLGTPAAPTATIGTNTTQIATTAFTQEALTARDPIDYGYAAWSPQFSSTTVPVDGGIAAPNATGTPASRTFDATTYLGASKKVQIASTTSTTNSVVHYRLASTMFAGKWGYKVRYRFATSDAAQVSGAAMFAGVVATTGGITAGDPSASASSFFFGNDTGDTNYQIIANDGTTATKVDLGASFPVNPVTPDVYDVVLTVGVNSTSGTYTIKRIDQSTGAVTATITGTKTGLPAVTTALATQIWRCSRGTALAVAFDLIGASFYNRQ